MAHLIECLPDVHKCLGFVYQPGVVVHAHDSSIPALGRQRKEEFKASLGYLRPAPKKSNQPTSLQTTTKTETRTGWSANGVGPLVKVLTLTPVNRRI